MPPPPGFQLTAMQRPIADAPRLSQEEAAIQDIAVQLDPPSAEKLFKLESERAWRERVRQEAKGRTPPDRITFPEEVQLTAENYQPRSWPTMAVVVEPYFVGYEKLLFEQRSAERYGWDLGPIHPVVSAGIFFKDLAFLPYHIMSDPFRCYEYNSGYCLPGDPVPLLLYPPELSLSGTVAETAAVLAVLAIFP